MNVQQLLKLSKTELINKCKEKNKPISGTKQDLARRLIDSDICEADTNKIPDNVIRIEKNEYGMYVHKPTDLVFSPTHRWVIGRIHNDSAIKPLRRYDIQICHKYKFNYVRPDTIEDDDIIYEVIENEYDNFNVDSTDSDIDNESEDEVFENDNDLSENEMI